MGGNFKERSHFAQRPCERPYGIAFALNRLANSKAHPTKIYALALTKWREIMAHKKKHSGPIPQGNKSTFGPKGKREVEQGADEQQPAAPTQLEQGEERRLGNFESAGGHAFQQPGGKNDANR